MTLDLSDRTQATMFCGTHEPSETRIVERLLADGDVFVDVGAHVGWFTLLAATLVRPTGRVIAFEPYPPNVEQLRTNVQLNRLDNVQLVEAGVGTALIHATVGRQSDSGSATLGTGNLADAFDVPVVTLDTAIAEDVAPALVKIDAEGLEEEVVRGGSGTLSRTRAVLIEINSSALRRNRSSEAAVVGLLEALGFIHFEDLPSGRPFGRDTPGQKNLLVRR